MTSSVEAGHGGRRGSGGGWPFFTSPYSSDAWNDDATNSTSRLDRANVDWRESHGFHIFTLDLPGVRKEDLKVQLEDNNVLYICGNRVVEKEEENDRWHRVECRRGSLSRQFRLPENAELDGINCGLEDGVLTVKVPKKEVQEQPRQVKYIDVQ